MRVDWILASQPATYIYMEFVANGDAPETLPWNFASVGAVVIEAEFLGMDREVQYSTGLLTAGSSAGDRVGVDLGNDYNNRAQGALEVKANCKHAAHLLYVTPPLCNLSTRNIDGAK